MVGIRQVVGLIWLSVALAPCLSAQGASATVTGTLKDSSGAVVPNSSVAAQSVETGREYSTLTNEAGIYTLAAVPPGRYTIKVEVSGFKRLVTNQIELEVNQVARSDLTLEVGATAETVEVKDLAPVLQTATTQRGSGVS